MAGWTCARCSTVNEESGTSCSSCGLMRGSVVADVPRGPIGTESILVDRPTPQAPRPADGTGPAAAPWVPNAGSSAPPAADGLPPAAVPGADGPSSPPAVPEWVPPEAQPQVPAAPVPLWRRVPLGGLLFVVLIVGGGIVTWFFGAGRSDSGEISKSGDLVANELRVGDCYDLKVPDADEIEDVTAKPCTEEHEYELYFAGPMADGDYPAVSAFEDYVVANCDTAFAAYVGKAYADSTLDIYWLYPTDESWRQGDRTVQCAVYDPKITRLTASLKGANR